MSNTVIQQEEYMCFYFDSQVKRQNLKDTTEYHIQGTRLEDNYNYAIETLKLVDFNTKGLFENIIYTKALIKKGLLNISIDIYLEDIIKRLIHNYKFQILNEFSLLKQFIAFGNRTVNKNTFEFYENGICYAIELFNFITYCDYFTKCKIFNEQNTDIMRANVGGWDAIIENFELQGRLDDIESYIRDKKPFILKEYSRDEYIIEKVCNKILKVRENGMFHSKKQIKKANIQYVKVILEPEKPFYENFEKQVSINNYRNRKNIFVFHNAENPREKYREFKTFRENTKSIIDLENVFEYLLTEYNIGTQFDIFNF
tara:strand:- start:3626 stop:4567 length:942 start_codon:yes stop_codon:yes gene_type:complete